MDSQSGVISFLPKRMFVSKQVSTHSRPGMYFNYLKQKRVVTKNAFPN